jgi:hypothetical protein
MNHSLFCEKHSVSLCSKLSVAPETQWFCQGSMTCWDKFHQFYLPKKLFNAKGDISTGCALYLSRKAESNGDQNEDDDFSAKRTLVV